MPEALPWTPPTLATLVPFVAIVLFVCAAFVLALYRSSRRSWAGPAAAGVAIWLVLTGLFPLSGLPELHWGVLMAFLFVSNGVALGLAVSPVGRAVSEAPIAALIGFQAFRLPLELILHEWGEAGVIPMSMTWEGQNLDVITGVAALLAAGFAVVAGPKGAPAVGWAFNLLGLGLLLNVARVAVLSSPVPMRIFGDPPLVLAYHTPTVWIVPFCVSGALFGHLVLFRHLWGRETAE